MKILIGTTNPSKVNWFQKLLSQYNTEFITLRDIGVTDEPAENGKTPGENAVIKANFYGQFFDRVICNDSGLYFDAIPMNDPRQPGLHVRTPCGKRLDDEEMIEYYSGLIKKLGGKVLAYYMNGIAVYNCGKVSSFTDTKEKLRHSAFYMTDKPSPLRHAGWPLDSLSLNRHTGAYFVENSNADVSDADTSGADKIIIDEYQRRMIRFLAEALELM